MGLQFYYPLWLSFSQTTRYCGNCGLKRYQPVRIQSPKSPHDACHGPTIRSALQPNHHANPANTAESRTSAPSAARSQTATGALSSFLAAPVGGEGTFATAGCAGAGGAGVVVAAGAGVGVDGVGAAAAGWVGVGAGAAAAAGFLPQSAFRSRAFWTASRNDGAYCSTSGGVWRSAFDSCLSEKRQGLIVPVRLYSR